MNAENNRNAASRSRSRPEARGSASGPKFKVGDRVSVPVRFGETGTVKELKDGRYDVEFHNLPMTLWYDENELRPQTGKGFNWFRMLNDQALPHGGAERTPNAK